jgi:hypothetical protein
MGKGALFALSVWAKSYMRRAQPATARRSILPTLRIAGEVIE